MPLTCAKGLSEHFSAAMAAIGNFEPAPVLCSAVSGGSDSLALTLLLHAWVQPSGGRVIALTVDHGLRSASADEALAVAQQLSTFGIRHITLLWQGPKPATGVQAAAREARYRLMARWCEDQHVLHLFTGHHSGDQIETHVMRKRRGSTPFGLAGMAPERLLANVRHLRPLLGTARSDLQSLLLENRLSWLEDPSNDDQRYSRVQVRSELKNFLPEVLLSLESEITNHAAERRKLSSSVATALGRSVSLFVYGYARLNVADLFEHSSEVAERSLLRLIMTIGGKPFAPRLAALRALSRRLQRPDFKGATLGGVSFKPIADGNGRRTMIVTREPRNLPIRAKLELKSEFVWDGRFRIRPDDGGRAKEGLRGLHISPLEQQGWLQVGASIRDRIPHRAALSLPALWRGAEVLTLPGLQLGPEQDQSAKSPVSMTFAPRHRLDAA